MKIVVTMVVTNKHKEQFKAIIPDGDFHYIPRKELKEEDVADAEIILGNLDPKLLKGADKLKWLQLNNAGTEGFWNQDLFRKEIILTNATGAYGTIIAEHGLAMILALQKRLMSYQSLQQMHKWQFAGDPLMFEGSTVLVIGFGDIGSTFAKKAKALGCYVIGIKRRKTEMPEYLDELYLTEELDHVIPRADIIMMSLPANQNTYHLMNENRLKLAKNDAIIVNMGRGSTIDTEALTTALETGEIGGAALDVTEPEPLPQDHRLWNLPNVLITPHISGNHDIPVTLDKIIDICAENMKRYLKNERMINIVDEHTGYCK